MNQRFTYTILPLSIPFADIYTFSAKERDSETGFSYFGSRYYSSDLSIWLSANSYKEVKNNDHLFVLTNDCGSDNGHSFKGYTPKNGGMVALVNAALFKGPIDGTFGREGAIAAAHEMGHMFGLNHVGNPFNLMRTGFFHNRLNSFVSSRQLGNIIRNIQFKSPLIKKVNNR